MQGMTKKDFTIIVFSENRTGILFRVIGIVTRRHINIMSINASESAIPGIHKITIVINVELAEVEKLVAQIDKQIDVLKAFHYTNDKIVYQEIALYKVPTKSFHNGDLVENIVRKHNAKILRIEEEYTVIEKSGTKEDTDALLLALKKTGIYEFVRTGRVAIVKPMEQLNTYLKHINSNSFN